MIGVTQDAYHESLGTRNIEQRVARFKRCSRGSGYGHARRFIAVCELISVGGDGQTNLMLLHSLFFPLGSRLTRFNDYDKQIPDKARVKKQSALKNRNRYREPWIRQQILRNVSRKYSTRIRDRDPFTVQVNMFNENKSSH